MKNDASTIVFLCPILLNTFVHLLVRDLIISPEGKTSASLFSALFSRLTTVMFPKATDFSFSNSSTNVFKSFEGLLFHEHLPQGDTLYKMKSMNRMQI